MAAKNPGDVVTKRVVVIGAGLGGLSVANAIAANPAFSVTVLEAGDAIRPYDDGPIRTGSATNLRFTRGKGIGGSTNFWHSGFMRMPTYVAWYRRLFPDDTYLLKVLDFFRIKPKYVLNDSGTQKIYYPFRRIRQRPADRVVALADVSDIVVDSQNHTLSCRIKGADRAFDYDALIVSAGGLASAGILARNLSLAEPQRAILGRNLTDHISTNAVIVRFKHWKLRSFSTLTLGGISRSAKLVREEKHGLDHIFFPRPCLRFSDSAHSQLLKSDIMALYAQRNKLAIAFRLLRNFDLFLELVVNKIPMSIPSRMIRYSIISEQESQNDNSIGWRQDKENIDWNITDIERDSIYAAIDKFVSGLEEEIENVRIVSIKEDEYSACCHHSGTVPIETANRDGVVDQSLEVIGVPDVFVCDGSVLPSTSVANTGLTIMELAFRLADHIQQRYS